MLPLRDSVLRPGDLNLLHTAMKGQNSPAGIDASGLFAPSLVRRCMTLRYHQYRVQSVQTVPGMMQDRVTFTLIHTNTGEAHEDAHLS